MTKFYFAGKIDKHDWRESIAGSEIGIWRYNNDGVKPVFIGGRDWYVGPWYIACDHGCYHGRNNHGAGASDGGCGYDMNQDTVHKMCLDGIKKCDVLYAWIDSIDCYGTLSEIGYAAGLGKTIWVSYSRSFLEKSHNPELYTEYDIVDGSIIAEIHMDHNSTRFHDMWFIDKFATRVSIGTNPVDSFRVHKHEEGI